uniref:Reverse transcriptase domain-containing protein n=1 Tax=Brugia pahangi TaxID=6280 RepID=A0A0N4TKJ7_BRUPA
LDDIWNQGRIEISVFQKKANLKRIKVFEGKKTIQEMSNKRSQGTIMKFPNDIADQTNKLVDDDALRKSQLAQTDDCLAYK